MAQEIVCPNCDTKLKASEKLLGRRVKCPRCSKEFMVPAEAGGPPVATPTAATPPVTAPTAAGPPAVPPQQAMQQCPFCAEMIAATAKKCKHCGETVDVALRASQEARRAAELAQSGGGGGGAAASTTVVIDRGGPTVVYQKSFPHGLHLVLTIVTCGVWLPVWIIHYIVRSLST